jgi:Avidin family
MNRLLSVVLGMAAVAASANSSCAADYSKRAMALDPSIRTSLIGKWTNPVDRVVIDITSVNLTSGQIAGEEWPTTGLASGNHHDLVGWVNAAPPRPDFDNVIPVSFSTTLFEYGTLPSWSGFLKDGKLVTMHYLVWPNRSYSWDHISSFQETWTRIP